MVKAGFGLGFSFHNARRSIAAPLLAEVSQHLPVGKFSLGRVSGTIMLESVLALRGGSYYESNTDQHINIDASAIHSGCSSSLLKSVVIFL